MNEGDENVGARTPALVSVVMPAFNAQASVVEAIASVRSQTYQNWELIVVDDCSTDRTGELVLDIAQVDARVTLLSLDRNNGAPAAPRNYGVREARGDWIAFLDADDIWHPQKLEHQMAVLSSGQFVFCSTAMRDFEDSASIVQGSPDSYDVKEVTFAMQRVKGRISTSSVVIRRDVIEALPFNEDLRYKAVEDYHCWLLVHQRYGPSAKLGFPFLYYRRGEGQISGSKTYMLGRVFMVHREFPGVGVIRALAYTFTHMMGGIYFRMMKGGL